MGEDRALVVLRASVACCAVGVALHRVNAKPVVSQKVQSELVESSNKASDCTQLMQQETIIPKSLHPVIQNQQQLYSIQRNVGWIKDCFQNHRTRGHIQALLQHLSVRSTVLVVQ